MNRAVVQVPAFEEGASMLETLRQIRAQDPPDGWEVTFQVWVTLSPPDRELCDTWQAAVEAGGWEVYEAPHGKLSARNAAHDAAVEDGFDAIVSWDADAKPLSGDAVKALLTPLEREGVAAVNSRPVSRNNGPLGLVVDVFSGFEDIVFPHLNGQAHSFIAEAWREAGPFDTDLDQTKMQEVRPEEEFAFRRRVSRVGSIVMTPEAVVENDMRRLWCKVPLLGQSGYCDARGEKTFERRN